MYIHCINQPVNLAVKSHLVLTCSLAAAAGWLPVTSKRDDDINKRSKPFILTPLDSSVPQSFFSRKYNSYQAFQSAYQIPWPSSHLPNTNTRVLIHIYPSYHNTHPTLYHRTHSTPWEAHELTYVPYQPSRRYCITSRRGNQRDHAPFPQTQSKHLHLRLPSLLPDAEDAAQILQSACKPHASLLSRTFANRAYQNYIMSTKEITSFLFIRQPSISIIFTAITFSISLRSSISPKKWLTVKIHKQFTPIPTSSTRDS